MKKAIYLSLLTLLLSSCGHANEKIMKLSDYEECQDTFHLSRISPLDGWYLFQAEFYEDSLKIYDIEYFFELTFLKSEEIEGTYKANLESAIGKIKTYEKFEYNKEYDSSICEDIIYDGVLYHKEELITTCNKKVSGYNFYERLSFNHDEYKQNVIELCYNTTEAFKNLYQNTYDSLETLFGGTFIEIEFYDSSFKSLTYRVCDINQINHKYKSSAYFWLEDRYTKIEGEYTIDKISEEAAPIIVKPNYENYDDYSRERKYFKLLADVLYV